MLKLTSYYFINEKSNSKLNLYAFDQRGHGFSQARAEPSELNSWSVFLEDGLDFIDSLSGKIICSGHSMGSVIAAKIASLRKEYRIEIIYD